MALFAVLLQVTGCESTDKKLKKARENLDSGNYEAVIAITDEVLEDEENCQALIYKGVALFMQEEYSGAENSFSRAVGSCDSTNYKPYLNRGNVYFRQEKYSEAVDDYSAGIAVSPDIADLYTSRGAAYMEMEKPSEALQDFNKALEIDPDLQGARMNRGKALLLLQLPQQAFQDLSKVDTPEATYLSGLAQIEAGNDELGCRLLSQAAEAGFARADELIRKRCE